MKTLLRLVLCALLPSLAQAQFSPYGVQLIQKPNAISARGWLFAQEQIYAGTNIFFYRVADHLFIASSGGGGGGGSGSVTNFQSGNLSPLFTTSVATPTAYPSLSFTLTSQAANTVFAGPILGAAAAPTFRTLLAADIPALSYVTSVGLSMPSEFSVASSPITGAGSITVTKANQNAHEFYAGPTSGAASAPAFRAITDPGDIQIDTLTNKVQASKIVGVISSVIGTSDYSLTALAPDAGSNTWVDFTKPMQYWTGTGAVAFRYSTNWAGGATGRVARIFFPPTNYVRSVYVFDAATNWATLGFASPMILPGGIGAELRSASYGEGETNVFTQFLISSKQLFNSEVVFNPAAVAGMVLWLDASQQLYTDVAGTTPVAASGDVVRRWNDLSGAGNYVTNANSVATWNQFGGTNSTACVTFTGAANSWFKSSQSNNITTPQWTFVVHSRHAASVVTVISGKNNTAGGIEQSAAGLLSLHSGTALNDGTFGTDVWLLAAGKFNSLTSIIRTNGVQAATGTTGANIQYGFTVGARFNPAQVHNGGISEILVYTSDLSAGNIANIEEYLRAKYNLY